MKSSVTKLGIALLGFLSITTSAQAAGARSVSQYNIKWIFSEEKTVGQFVNGDWWVVGPVTITEIDTSANDGPNGPFGAMINPMPATSQGLLNQAADPQLPYNSGKDIRTKLPYTVSAGNSLCSVTSNDLVNWSVEKTFFRDFAVLTILDKAPPEGSFRPPYTGTDKTIRHNVKDINYRAFKRVTPPIKAHVPDRLWLESATVRPLLEMAHFYKNSDFKAADGRYHPRRTYGREIGAISLAACVYLNLDYSDKAKERLMINMCQWGIDVYGLTLNGMIWYPLGGHQAGRKIPLLVAAKALGDSDMISRCNTQIYNGFQEDMYITFIKQSDIDTPRLPVGSGNAPYTQDMLGMPEWIAPFSDERSKSSPTWNMTGYRQQNGGQGCGFVLCAMLLGAREIYHHEAYFRYHIERYYPTEKASHGGTVPNYGDSIQEIVFDLWNEHVLGINSSISPPKELKISR